MVVSGLALAKCSNGRRPLVGECRGRRAFGRLDRAIGRKPIIRIPQQGRTVSLVGDVYRFLATGEDTNCKYALIEVLVGPAGGPPPHVHSREEEGFYILEGEITLD